MSTAANETELREAIVDVGLRMWQRELVAANDGNVSVRLDDERLLCTPTGISKGRMRPSDLAIVALDGTLLDAGTGRGPSSEMKMHLRAYRVGSETGTPVNAVVHAHPPYSTSFAIRGEAITSTMLAETVVFMPSVPLAPYAMPSTEEVPDSVAPFIAEYNACLLEHHGALTWGPDLEEAYLSMERLEYLARMVFLMRQSGGERELSAERVSRLKAHFNLA
ncbi:class II aldolase/adducin family protein [Leucobacter sp. M11]|uniref:class II aldolase/adducin family protein n=1 Tax=Leucobacter sp. M11 TaxID=2993565 RepID=UPI002D7ED2A8|nr:class II aldolase/adducin family protein [Leucobacter sp. M11]MEB4615736.1 class II aldolase/adducin family protein [Leucobacter sp. M11]